MQRAAARNGNAHTYTHTHTHTPEQRQDTLSRVAATGGTRWRSRYRAMVSRVFLLLLCVYLELLVHVNDVMLMVQGALVSRASRGAKLGDGDKIGRMGPALCRGCSVFGKFDSSSPNAYHTHPHTHTHRLTSDVFHKSTISAHFPSRGTCLHGDDDGKNSTQISITATVRPFPASHASHTASTPPLMHRGWGWGGRWVCFPCCTAGCTKSPPQLHACGWENRTRIPTHTPEHTHTHSHTLTHTHTPHRTKHCFVCWLLLRFTWRIHNASRFGEGFRLSHSKPPKWPPCEAGQLVVDVAGRGAVHFTKYTG